MSKSKLELVDNDKSWYTDGLPFKCTGCGKCCTGGPGAVWIDHKEIGALAKHLQIDESTFVEKYTCVIDGKRSLREKNDSYDCVFLADNKCSVYTHRPTQCRTYPFWPRHLKSETAWKEASQWCEGMGPDAPLVPIDEIEKQLNIHLSNNVP